MARPARKTAPDRASVLSALRASSSSLRERFGVRQIGLFGSVARDEGKPRSDVDVLVTLDHPTYDGYLDLKEYLEGLVGAKVDLVLEDALKPRLRPHVLAEVIDATVG
jgi:predicted nucleotidyltransferase